MSMIATCGTCRVGVQFDALRLDFVLPADVAVAAVIPSIVDHVAIGTAAAPPHDGCEVPTDWQLARIDGSQLILRASLRDNGICDGDILWLSRVRTAVAAPRDDGIAEMAVSLDARPRFTSTASAVAASIILVCCTGLVGYALLRSKAHQGAHTSAIFAGLLCASAFVAALACGRAHRETISASALGSCATACAAVAGYLAVPGDPEAPKLMLAAAAGATVAVLAARYTGRGSTVFVATAALGYLSAAAACAHLFVDAGVDAAGAILGAAAIVMLAVTAPLAIWMSRLQVPRLPSSSGRVPADPVPRDVADHARRTHAIATGLLCGFSAAALVGAALAAFGGTVNGALFAAIVALVLVLRAGTHVDLVQTAAVIACGTASFAVVFVRAVDVWPRHAIWSCLGAVGMSAGAAVLLITPRPAITSPLTRRCVELAEYAALAAVIPAACWVSGVFGAVRGLS
jgi:type VII secretion integral membrane protein EccD